LWAIFHEIPDTRRSVCVQTIPHDHERAIKVPEELAEKIDDALSVEVSIRLKAKI